MSTPIPNCLLCQRFRGLRNEADDVGTCDAFPGGIPHEIAFGENLHEEPFDGDGGLIFLVKPELAEFVVETS